VFRFNVFAILVVDLLHEFEIGVWKAIFTHLLRMVESLKGHKLRKLDQRKVIIILIPYQLFTSYLQISPSPHFWAGYNPTLFKECIRDEKNGSI
jgi:hypothetical protein